eukprot:357234-Chlamydomonas_euryale.AAC.4
MSAGAQPRDQSRAHATRGVTPLPLRAAAGQASASARARVAVSGMRSAALRACRLACREAHCDRCWAKTAGCPMFSLRDGSAAAAVAGASVDSRHDDLCAPVDCATRGTPCGWYARHGVRASAALCVRRRQGPSLPAACVGGAGARLEVSLTRPGKGGRKRRQGGGGMWPTRWRAACARRCSDREGAQLPRSATPPHRGWSGEWLWGRDGSV